MDVSQRISITPKPHVRPPHAMVKVYQTIRSKTKPPVQQKILQNSSSSVQKDPAHLKNMATAKFLSNLQRNTGLSISVSTIRSASPTTTIRQQPVVNNVSLSMPSLSRTPIYPVVRSQPGISDPQRVVTSGDSDVTNPPVTTPLLSEVAKQSSNPVAQPRSVPSRSENNQELETRENQRRLAMKETLSRFGDEELWETFVSLETKRSTCVKRIKDLRTLERKLESQQTRAQNKAKREDDVLSKITARRDALKVRTKETESLIARFYSEKNMDAQINEVKIANCEAVLQQCKLEMQLLENPDDVTIKAELDKATELIAATEKRYKALQENRAAVTKQGVKDVHELKRKMLQDKELLWRCEGEVGKLSDAKVRREKDREKRERKLRNAKAQIHETSTEIATLNRELIRQHARMFETIWMRKLELAEAAGTEVDFMPKVSWVNAADVQGFEQVLVTDTEGSSGSKASPSPTTHDGMTDQLSPVSGSEQAALSRPVSPCLSSSSLDGPLTTEAQALLLSTPEISDDSDLELMIVEEHVGTPNPAVVTKVDVDEMA